ncbi:MAG TPA: response regulator transcription factor [Candidatus Paceibacterota bacterium]|nr:response regulator transcription factor [Candidatus Paceibacterota bacterium]
MLKKILLVEDDPLLVKMYAAAFAHSGYDAHIAFNGEEGLVKLMEMKDDPPTVVVTDVMMPKMNGLEFIRQLKADPNFKKIPVIVLTNLSGQTDATEALKLGAITYLVKSEYEPKEILAKIEEIMEAYSRGSNVPDVTVTVKDAKPDGGA